MELKDYVGERIRVTDIDDQIFEGNCVDDAQSADNDPEIASIAVDTGSLTYEIYENEIISIEVIE